VYLAPNYLPPALCFPQTFAFHVWRASQHDAVGFSVVGFLFRALSPEKKSFRATPLQSSALGARMKKYLRDSELYAGETNHSFRRGALQAAAGLGFGEAAT
jgi:hypothetical protein